MGTRPLVGIDIDTAVLSELFDPAGPLSPLEAGALLDASAVDFAILGGDVLDPRVAPEQRFDASVAAALLAANSRRIGLVVAADPRVHHPYNLARRLASLDHLSGGRIGWLVGAGASSGPAEGVESLLDDAVTVARKLWESWPADSIVADRERAVFVESERITFIDHEGVFSVSGPLNVPEPPQRKLPVFRFSDTAPDSIAGAPDVVIVRGTDEGAHQQILTLREVTWNGSWDVEAPERGGVVVRIRDVHDLESVATVAGPRPPGAGDTTLRERLGLPAASRILSGHRRSLFPVS
ncbi:LLM class flavin-dependent oxidoreductase [Rhodococcus sp. NPDC003382]|uniref:LLM class flavin-dependent oxidoreductase n=1 Tax=Rhodococcus sp. HM1 TaxID=2937759 RepID=UPI00200A4726|nr:LLM class flavin-dependent oxidoreductase [Rhodococcus sp. HM1]MCK8674024.1 LLM class flavin-dependent oxidoreductase [Rhodococcus sp. HM1]